MTCICTKDRHNSQSQSRVAICVHDNEILEISAGTTCNRQMTQCRINRYRKGADNPLKKYFANNTIIVHGRITQHPTDLCIQITSNCDYLMPLIIKGNFIGADVDSVSIGQKCQMRWDFRGQATQFMQHMSFDICHATNYEHITTLVIMLEFHGA